MICMKCYKATETLVPIEVDGDKTEQGVCKGCFYDINKVRGFLLTQGVRWVLIKDQQEEANVPPQTPPKKKR